MTHPMRSREQRELLKLRFRVAAVRAISSGMANSDLLRKVAVNAVMWWQIEKIIIAGPHMKSLRVQYESNIKLSYC